MVLNITLAKACWVFERLLSRLDLADSLSALKGSGLFLFLNLLNIMFSLLARTTDVFINVVLFKGCCVTIVWWTCFSMSCISSKYLSEIFPELPELISQSSLPSLKF